MNGSLNRVISRAPVELIIFSLHHLSLIFLGNWCLADCKGIFQAIFITIIFSGIKLLYWLTWMQQIHPLPNPKSPSHHNSLPQWMNFCSIITSAVAAVWQLFVCMFEQSALKGYISIVRFPKKLFLIHYTIVEWRSLWDHNRSSIRIFPLRHLSLGGD